MEIRESKLRKHFEEKGFYVGDGLKYGVDLLLYTDHPDRVHSKYAVLINRRHTFLQVLAVQRVCSSSRKVLIMAYLDKDGAIRLASLERFVTCGRRHSHTQSTMPSTDTC